MASRAYRRGAYWHGNAEDAYPATARYPCYGELNCFGWLLMLSNHYIAHLGALAVEEKTAL